MCSDPGDVETLLDPSNRRALRKAMGIAMEFVFHAKVFVNGKPKKQWSQVRPIIQDIVQKGVAQSRAVMPGDSGDALDALTQDLARDALIAASSTPGEKSISLMLTEQSADAVRKWLSTNSSVNLCDHAAYCAARAKLRARLRKCQRDASACPVHSGACLSLADLLWLSSDCIFDNIPCSVPTLPLALTVKITESSTQVLAPTADSRTETVQVPFDGCVPAFCRFLCKETTINTGGEGPDSSTTVWPPTTPLSRC